MNITPNQITIARIIALPFGIWTLFQEGTVWALIAYAIFFTIAMSDVIDGRLARSRGQITEFGALLDPIADKLMIAAAMIPLSILDRFPWWATIAILFREIGITIFRAVVISSGVIHANRGGKLKTLSQNLGVGWFILPLPAFLDWFKYGWLYIAVALTYITGYWYIRAWVAYRQDSAD
jgi:CDP-diacylglycerol--glycerol-3-phosphate 3-phosphatidyltransferase